MFDTLTIVNYALLVPLAALITYYDARYRRIPNAFVLATLVAGLAINTTLGGWPGLLASLGGCLAAFCLMLLLHVFGAMGAGDVKLFAAIGSGISSPPRRPVLPVVRFTGRPPPIGPM